MNLVSLQSLLNRLLYNAKISFFPKVDNFCCIGSHLHWNYVLNKGLHNSEKFIEGIMVKFMGTFSNQGQLISMCIKCVQIFTWNIHYISTSMILRCSKYFVDESFIKKNRVSIHTKTHSISLRAYTGHFEYRSQGKYLEGISASFS